MKFLDKLLQETDFLQQLKKLEQLEKDRKFCKHDLNHLVDTARIAWIAYLEGAWKQDKSELEMELVKEKCIEKEMFYLAALLHDLGRIREYEDGTSHHIASAMLAEKYLANIGYPQKKGKVIVSAVYGHRKKHGQGAEKVFECEDISEEYSGISQLLGELLYFADKKSRNCFYCEAAEACNWEQERRNVKIIC